MSERLHIGPTSELFYDCVVVDENNVREKLLSEWLGYSGLTGMFFGPLKVRIGDVELFNKIEPVIAEVFTFLRKKYPDDVWFFFHGESEIEHPNRKQFDRWLKKQT